jgi:hypothetical protein
MKCSSGKRIYLLAGKAFPNIDPPDTNFRVARHSGVMLEKERCRNDLDKLAVCAEKRRIYVRACCLQNY